MNNKEQKITKELKKCKDNIQRTKKLIEYHKDILKKQESKENELSAKLEKIKMASLCEVINRGGFDIDLLRSAVQTGDFSSIAHAKDLSGVKENPASESKQDFVSENAVDVSDAISEKEGEE